MTDTLEPNGDLALEALGALSEAAQASADELRSINDDIDTMRRRRSRGWSWRRIMASMDSPNALSAITGVAVRLGSACGEFRRSLAQTLRAEGMRTAEMGSLLGVSRQRVSALLHAKRPD